LKERVANVKPVLSQRIHSKGAIYNRKVDYNMDYENIRKRAAEARKKADDAARVKALAENASTLQERMVAYYVAKVYAGEPELSDDATPEEIDNFFRGCTAYQKMKAKLAANEVKANLNYKSEEQKKRETASKDVKRLLGKE